MHPSSIIIRTLKETRNALDDYGALVRLHRSIARSIARSRARRTVGVLSPIITAYRVEHGMSFDCGHK